jgi:hypothetical protein
VPIAVTVTVQDESPAGRCVRAVSLPDIPAAITLRDLIRARVRAEVARQDLVPEQRRAGWREHADRAVELFGRNGFFVLIDDRQVTDLDQKLALTPHTDIRFVRLTPLAGG